MFARKREKKCMRRFSKQEKNYIRELCDNAKPGKSYIPANLLYWTFHEENVAFDATTREFIFYRPKEENDNTALLSIEGKIIEATLLLDYLEKEGLIFYIKDSNGGLDYFGVPKNSNLIDTNTTVPKCKQVPEGIEGPLMKSMNHRVIVGQTLIDYVDNGFKTVEDLQLDEARAQSKIAIKSLEEARIQSKKAIESLDEARIQSKTAIKSLKEAKKQTWWSIGALIVAVVTMFVTIAVQVCITQSVRVEEVKSPVIQTIKKEILPKQETDKRALPAVRQKKRDSVKLTSGNKIKRTK